MHTQKQSTTKLTRKSFLFRSSAAFWPGCLHHHKEMTNSRQARREFVFHLRKLYLNFSFVCATWSLALKKVLGANTLLPACSSLVPPLAGAHVGRWAVVMAYCTGLRLLVRCKLACSYQVLLCQATSKKAVTLRTLRSCLNPEWPSSKGRARYKSLGICAVSCGKQIFFFKHLQGF